MAPRAGLEPATLRLTAGCSAIELPRNTGRTSLAEKNPYGKTKQGHRARKRTDAFTADRKALAGAKTYGDVAVTKETVTGDTAILELSGKDPKGQAATGSVPMTKEGSGWKVGAEKWSSKPR